MKNLWSVLIVILLLTGIAGAEEKPINIKSVSLGMSIDEARETLSKSLGSDWVISAKGETRIVLADYRVGNEQIFGTTYQSSMYNNYYVRNSGIVGNYGFAISRDNYYEGFVSGDPKTQKVTRISLSGEITEALYNPDKNQKLNMDDFVAQFTKHFNLPDFNWIPHGWIYQSPNGYVITLKTDKFIDLKIDESKNKKIVF